MRRCAKIRERHAGWEDGADDPALREMAEGRPCARSGCRARSQVKAGLGSRSTWRTRTTPHGNLGGVLGDQPITEENSTPSRITSSRLCDPCSRKQARQAGTSADAFMDRRASRLGRRVRKADGAVIVKAMRDTEVSDPWEGKRFCMFRSMAPTAACFGTCARSRATYARQPALDQM